MGIKEEPVGTTAAAQCLEHHNHLLVRTRKRAAVLRMCWGWAVVVSGMRVCLSGQARRRQITVLFGKNEEVDGSL